MRGNGEGREGGWKPLILVSLLAIVIFGGLALLFLVAPEGTRAARFGAGGAILFAVLGLLCIVTLIVFLRPGSPMLVHAARNDQALKDLVGTPSILFAGTVDPSDRAIFDQVSSLPTSANPIVMIAVGPNGLALGQPGRTPRTSMLSNGESDIRFAVGGPGGGLLRWKSAEHPTLLITWETGLGELTLTVDSLVSPRAGTAVRDERDVRQLVAELTALRANP